MPQVWLSPGRLTRRPVGPVGWDKFAASQQAVPTVPTVPTVPIAHNCRSSHFNPTSPQERGNAVTDHDRPTRRACLQGLGTLGAAALLGGGPRGTTAAPVAAEPPPQTSDLRNAIFAQVWKTPLIDTHEHLCDERDRLLAERRGRRPDDWTVVLSGYLGSDLLTAGMPQDVHGRFFANGLSPVEKWKLLEPYWPAVKNTGYGQAARISLRQLYGVEELSLDTVELARTGYERERQAGFYRKILCELGRIESCQVNWLDSPFLESTMPTLLMQDLSIVGMFAGPNLEMFGKPAGIQATELADWHQTIEWWFDKYGQYAVAVKSQDAYRRDIDYRQVSSEQAAEIFRRKVQQQPIEPQDQKALEDHLFWHAVRRPPNVISRSSCTPVTMPDRTGCRWTGSFATPVLRVSFAEWLRMLALCLCTSAIRTTRS